MFAKKDQETAKNFLVLKAAKSYLCDWMVERSSGARWMVYIHGGLCGVHLPVVIEVKRTCQSPGVSKIMKQMNSRRSHWTYIIVHPDHPWSSVVRYQFVWTWKQSGRHCSSCCNPSSRNTSSQISTLGKKQSRLGIGFFSQNSSPRRITGHISVHFAAEKVDPKTGEALEGGNLSPVGRIGSCREISIARKPREFCSKNSSSHDWGSKRWVTSEDHQLLKVNGYVFLDDPNEITAYNSCWRFYLWRL